MLNTPSATVSFRRILCYKKYWGNHALPDQETTDDVIVFLFTFFILAFFDQFFAAFYVE